MLNVHTGYVIDRVVHCNRPHEDRIPKHTPDGDRYIGGGGGGGTWGIMFFLRLSDVEDGEEIRPKVFMPTPSTPPK